MSFEAVPVASLSLKPQAGRGKSELRRAIEGLKEGHAIRATSGASAARSMAANINAKRNGSSPVIRIRTDVENHTYFIAVSRAAT